MRSVLRERRKQMLRDEILDAALELLETKGYTTMSMDELAGSVGISKPTLYSHFATKDELVIESLIRQIQRISEMLQSVEQSKSPLQRLILLLQTVVRLQIDKGEVSMRSWVPELYRLICEHPQAIESMRQLEMLVQETIEQAIVAREIDSSLNVQTVMRIFFSLLGTLSIPLLINTKVLDSQAVIDTITVAFERGVRPPSA